MDDTQSIKDNIKQPQKGKSSKVSLTSFQGVRRFQLLDPSTKSELVKIFEGGLVQFLFDTGGKDTLTVGDNGEEGKNTTVSLDFEGSDDDDNDHDLIENLPKNLESNELGCNANNENLGRRKGLSCGSCNVTFADTAEQRLHYTLDWHRYNLKRKLNEQNPVGEDAFDDMIDDLSSIDGSDDEDEEREGGKQIRLQNNLASIPASKTPAKELNSLSNAQKLENSPKLHFKTADGQIISCYKAILLPPGCARQEVASLLDQDLPKLISRPLKMTIIMASGGHFAAAVFEGNSCTHHKTFHSYTVRAKQGGSQGSRDAKTGGGSHPKSAGASLRRYNEQSFSQHVQDLLDSWKNDVTKSDFIFYRAVSSNANVLFSGKTPPLSRQSKNLRTIPFPTQRPTFNEVKRVHSLLTTIHVYESLEAFQSRHTIHTKNRKVTAADHGKTKKPVDRAKSISPKRKEDKLDVKTLSSESDSDENSELELVDHIVDLCDLKEYDDSINCNQKNENLKRKNQKSKSASKPILELEGAIAELSDHVQKGNLEIVKAVLRKLKDSNDPLDFNVPISTEGLTLLHTATKQNYTDIVWFLLEIGCDPVIKDKFGKCAYNYAETRECRDSFRLFMGQYPEKYDYKKAQVPPPLSNEMEKERAEKKRLLNKLKREREKQKKAERFEKEKETEEQRRFLNLSDREKRALAAEQRILAQCKKNAEKPPVLIRCFDCAADITGKVPFEYNQNVFCTPKCLAAHRKKFPCALSK